MVSPFLEPSSHGFDGGALAYEAEPAPFTITVRFKSDISDEHASAVERGADRWAKVITGGLSPVVIDGEIIDGVLIFAEVVEIDGPRGTLALGGPLVLRPQAAECGPKLPAIGELLLDSRDLARITDNGWFEDVVAHEIGHVLGIGTLWKRFVQQHDGADPTFLGEATVEAYAALRRADDVQPVPLENGGSTSASHIHWRETTMANELMSARIFDSGNPLSRLSVACLKDLGYDVRYEGAEDYELPSSGRLLEQRAATAKHRRSCRSLPRVARVLPASALVRARTR